MASRRNDPSTLLSHDEARALLGLAGGEQELEQILSECSWLHDRPDRLIKLGVVRKLADGMALERLRMFRSQVAPGP
jgi:uncharacterized protein (DUF58 family)